MMQRSTKRKIFILVAVAPCLAAASLFAQQMGGMGGGMGMPGNNSSQSPLFGNPVSSQNGNMVILPEQGYFRDLATNAQTETDLSRLALTNSGNDGVKKLAQQVIADHQKQDDAVSEAASKLKVVLQQGPSGHLRKLEKKMQSLTGSQFDQAYLKELSHDVTQDKNRANDEMLTTNAPDIRQLMLEVQDTAKNCSKQIADVGKAENLKLK